MAEVITDDPTEIVNEVAILASGVDVTIDKFGYGRAKVSGRPAHYIRDAVQSRNDLQVERDVNQCAFFVSWDAE